MQSKFSRNNRTIKNMVVSPPQQRILEVFFRDRPVICIQVLESIWSVKVIFHMKYCVTVWDFPAFCSDNLLNAVTFLSSFFFRVGRKRQKLIVTFVSTLFKKKHKKLEYIYAYFQTSVSSAMTIFFYRILVCSCCV